MAEEPRPGQENGYYVYCYCIVGPDVSVDLEGVGCLVGGLPPYSLSIGEVQAVASLVPTAEYNRDRLQRNIQRMDWLRAAVLSHEQVVEGCLRQTEVVPMKFGTIFHSEADLARALGRRQEEFASRLLDLGGKQEWNIRLVADRQRLRQHLLETSSALLELRNGVEHKPAGIAYFLRKQLEDRLTSTMEQSRTDAAESAYRRLAAIATGAVLPKATASGDGELVLNAAFLVTDEQLNQLLGEAVQIVSERPWLGCEPSGPWPPYNFV